MVTKKTNDIVIIKIETYYKKYWRSALSKYLQKKLCYKNKEIYNVLDKMILKLNSKPSVLDIIYVLTFLVFKVKNFYYT